MVMNRYIVMQRTESVVRSLPRETELSGWSQFAMVRTSSPPEDVLKILAGEEARYSNEVKKAMEEGVRHSFLVIP